MSAGQTTRARGRRIGHLVARFFETLHADPPDAAAVAWVAGVLTPAELQLWNEMGRADRAESLAVARRVETMLAGGEYAPDPRWYAAALLHDTGKSVSGYGTVGRVVVTVIAGGLGDARVRAWARPGADASGARVRMGRYVAHDEIGAELLRAGGARPEIAGWADAHHRPERWDRCGIPPAVCRALAVADGEPESA